MSSLGKVLVDYWIAYLWASAQVGMLQLIGTSMALHKHIMPASSSSSPRLVDQNNTIEIMYLDFSKAFWICPDILLHKIVKYKVDDVNVKRVGGFLKAAPNSAY